MFPSPCGVMGVKHIGYNSDYRGCWAILVSVPLRGNGCETCFGWSSCCSCWFCRVSVPLRGNGCETKEGRTQRNAKQSVSVPLRGNGCETEIFVFNKNMIEQSHLPFPSPCGVMGVKLWSQASLLSISTVVFPSPCGVMGVKPIKILV